MEDVTTKLGDTSLADYNLLDMATGNINGSLGEVGGIAILIGLAYLLLTKTITWHIPTAVIASAALFSWAFGGNPLLDIFAGGLLLGAVFMATDYVTSPMTHKGQLIFGAMIGLITIIIRRYGAYPEGMSFAILLMNSFVPLINRYCSDEVKTELLLELREMADGYQALCDMYKEKAGGFPDDSPMKKHWKAQFNKTEIFRKRMERNIDLVSGGETDAWKKDA